MTLRKLANRWEQEAEFLDGYGATEAGAAARRHAQELTEAIRTAEDEELTIGEAARVSGYSARRLRDLVAAGTVPNAGRKGAPRIRRRDLPRRASTARAEGFDVTKHAQEILGSTR